MTLHSEMTIGIPLLPRVRHYDWGARGKRAFIPRCLGIRPQPNTPYAELWFGDHPTAPSLVKTEQGERIPLDRFLKENARLFFPPGKQRKEARLPFLIKIIDAARPLSLQVHPDEKQSKAGFARENAAGIPRDSPDRCFPDPVAKPELLLALQPFDVLAGFLPWNVLRQDVWCGEIISLVGGPRPNTQRLVERLFRLSPERVRAIGQELFGRRNLPSGPRALWLRRLWAEHGLPKSDPACLMACFMNFRRLMPGESLEIRPGVPHTYLRGVGVEVMRNSDNVLRLGLTSKPVRFRSALKSILFNRPVLWQKKGSSPTLWVQKGKICARPLKAGIHRLRMTSRNFGFFMSFSRGASLGRRRSPVVVSLLPPGSATPCSGLGFLIQTL
ncbi:MAG: mannose-6-phosphate isomerase, class I [Elusimicrobia bacterium]|nr:mannose-6-phosphate isomerase, class I [Elusimicrobiota bacterium]